MLDCICSTGKRGVIMHKRLVFIPLLFLSLLVLFSLSASAQTSPTTGVFNITNVAPYAPYNWAPITTHYKNQNFTWVQPADANGDPITTYICITNDTDTETCQVVNTQASANNFWYAFTQAENFWDYAPFGIQTRIYYVNLTPNDGFTNGTSNSSIWFNLTDYTPSITGQTSNSSNKGDADVGQDILFYMTSHSDLDAVDNHSIRICNTSSIQTDGSCTVSGYCTSGAYSNDTNLNCTYTAQQSDNTSNLAYFFICDCPPYDLTCPGQCSAGYLHTFWVNHWPYATNVNISPFYPTTTNNLNCTYNFTDPDGDAEGTSTFRWFNWTGTAWVVTPYTTQLLSSANTNNGEKWMCEVTPVDQFSFAGYPMNSTNVTIGNAAPYMPTNFTVQDSATTYDVIPPVDTHDKTPFINWTNYDPDGNPVSTYVCIATSAANRDSDICDANYTFVSGNSVTILSGLDYLGTARVYYVRLTPYDGFQNGTWLDTNFTLLNSAPYQPNALFPLAFHTQTPTLSWNVSDPDDGSVDHWPADSLTDYIRVGTVYGDGTYENNNNANNDSELVDNPIPWGTPGPVWANNTVYASVWASDGYLNSTYYNTTLTLYDYLPDVTQVQLTDIGAYSTCTAAPGGCALSPVAGSNTTVAVRITATDTDNDCDIGSNSQANIYLCLYTSGTCDVTAYNFTWQVDNVTRSGSTCTYVFNVNKTAADGTPEFFRLANDSYMLNVNVSSQAGTRTSDTEADRLWQYNTLKALDYATLVILGGGNPVLGQWNNGTHLYVATNFGNDLLNLLWNTTDPTSGADTWLLNGTDMEIDDDNDHSSEPGPIPPTYLNATQKTFEPGWGLDICSEYACTNANLNETLDTYYHIAPPFGLQAGQYNNTITIQIS